MKENSALPVACCCGGATSTNKALQGPWTVLFDKSKTQNPITAITIAAVLSFLSRPIADASKVALEIKAKPIMMQIPPEKINGALRPNLV